MIIKSDIPTAVIQIRMKHQKSKSFTMSMDKITIPELYDVLVEASRGIWRKKQNE